MGTLGAAEVAYSPEMARSNELEATDLSESAAADQTTEPAAAQSQQAQQASQEPRVTTTTLQKQQLQQSLRVMQLVLLPALATVWMSQGGPLFYMFMVLQLLMSFNIFILMSYYGSVLGKGRLLGLEVVPYRRGLPEGMIQ
jgi:hypothetical protein